MHKENHFFCLRGERWGLGEWENFGVTNGKFYVCATALSQRPFLENVWFTKNSTKMPEEKKKKY